MKKQINPTIKAHLIRGAFYLLLLLAVCAIPFALAQRNAAAGKMSRMAPPSTRTITIPRNPDSAHLSAQAPDTSQAAQLQVPTKSSRPGIPVFSMPALPKLPQVVLYDQYNNNGPNATVRNSLRNLTRSRDFFPMTFADFRHCLGYRRFLSAPVVFVRRTCSRFRERRKFLR